VVLSAVASHPVEAHAADELLTGARLSEETIAAAAEAAAKPAKPLDNADLSYVWRKKMVRVVVEEALRKAAAR
jgi:CO/xanthine dehydrogenase FAD-binding subunit